MKKTILSIEDEPSLQRVLSDTLEQKGYKVLKAMDGETGWKMSKEEKPDLILLDLILPKKDGFSVLADLKKDPETKNIPVIILTNLEGVVDVERVIELGATTFLIKANYELKEIVEKIEGILSKST